MLREQQKVFNKEITLSTTQKDQNYIKFQFTGSNYLKVRMKEGDKSRKAN